MLQIKFYSCACFSPLQVILYGGIKIFLALKLSELQQFENRAANLIGNIS